MSRQIKLTVFILLIFSLTYSQKDRHPLIQEFGVPYYSFEILTEPMDDWETIKTTIYLKVPYDALQFVKEGKEFLARYEVALLLFNDQEAQVASRIWQQEIRTTNFALTNSTEDFDYSHTTFQLKPGFYKINIGVMDLDSRKTGHRKKSLPLKDFYSKPIAMGNIQLLEKHIKKDESSGDFIPSVQNAISDNDSLLYFRYSIISRNKDVRILWKIQDQEEKTILSHTEAKEVGKGVFSEIVHISKRKLTFRPYVLKVEVESGGEKISRSVPFQVRWIGMTRLIDDLDSAVEQLRYIAKSGEISNMLRADKEKKKELFLKFWKKMDPTPDTQANELMNEYYRRVQYANEHFSGFLEGWQTDMGMIFILFGPPSDIERHPFDISTKPYEIWYYYEINRYFVFVDETGFGEYRLITPINDPNLRY